MEIIGAANQSSAPIFIDRNQIRSTDKLFDLDKKIEPETSIIAHTNQNACGCSDAIRSAAELFVDAQYFSERNVAEKQKKKIFLKISRVVPFVLFASTSSTIKLLYCNALVNTI